MLMIEKKAKNVKYHSEVIVLEKRVNELTK